MIVRVKSCAILGIDGRVVDVEVDFNPRSAIPSFVIVGLPDTAVRESRERIRAAIKNSNYATRQHMQGGSSRATDFSSSMSSGQNAQQNEEHRSGLQFVNKGYIANLSPADLPKHGPAYDLSIAIGVLAATDQIPLASLDSAMFIGELSLDGTIRHVKGVMSMALAAAQAGLETVYVPTDDAQEAAMIGGVTVIPVNTLGQLVEHLYNMAPIRPVEIDVQQVLDNGIAAAAGLTDFADVRGQELAKRALEIAAAGNHNMRMSGPPGSGKTLLARALPGILPRLTLDEALEVTRIYSVVDEVSGGLMLTRPFRAPHHTISLAGMVGGGTIPRPGEVTLAHRGVLFLDEANEHSQHTLEGLRQPIEDRVVTISRAKGSLTFPANFLLVLAHNPCPCGFLGDLSRACTCTPAMISRYQAKLSGPLLDRIDLHVEVPRVEIEKLTTVERGESSEAVRVRVEAARAVQRQRFTGMTIHANADMDVKEIGQFCTFGPNAKHLLDSAVRRMSLSARSYHRMIKLSRTIADLDGAPDIEVAHIAEALTYRPKSGDA